MCLLFIFILFVLIRLLLDLLYVFTIDLYSFFTMYGLMYMFVYRFIIDLCMYLCIYSCVVRAEVRVVCERESERERESLCVCMRFTCEVRGAKVECSRNSPIVKCIGLIVIEKIIFVPKRPGALGTV